MMSDEPPQISILDARLAEIDRRLRTIQTGLVGEQPSAAGGESLAAERPAAEPEPEPEPAERGLSHPEPSASSIALPPRVEVPEPPPAPASAEPEAAADLVAELRELAAVHERLLDSMRELVAAYERALARLGRAAPADVKEFSVSAGPFPSTEALRGFERTLSLIPEVREVAVRGYEGEDRAIVDVHLFDSTS